MRAWRGALLVALLGAAALPACVEEGAPTTQASVPAGAPVVASVDARSEGNGIVTLSVKASDPKGSPLRYRWAVDAGTLAAPNGQMVQWKVPKAAGLYQATVEVSNGEGAVTVGTAQFRVAADGTTTQAGQVAVASRPASASTSGSFNIPSPLGSRAPVVNAVGNNPTATAASPTPTPSPLSQPVATPAANQPSPVPGATPVPIATPTPTPVPSLRPPSPLPTPKPPTPQPLASIPPQVMWQPYDPSKIPTTENLRDLHFTSENRGWFIGGTNTVLLYDRVDPLVEPSLRYANGLLDSNGLLNQVHFISDTTGFIADSLGQVWRTTDAGNSWFASDVGSGGISAMVVFNATEVLVGDELGQVFRTQNANATNVNQIVWTKQDTKPPQRAGDVANYLNAAAAFPTDPTLSYWVGDGIYRLDVDHPDTSQRWRRVFRPLGLNENTTRPGDGQIVSITMLAQNDIFAGTSTGNLLRSQDGGTTWTALANNRFLNGMQNGNALATYLLPLGSLNGITALDVNNIIVGGAAVYDTTDGMATWRQAPKSTYFMVRQLQMFHAVANNLAEIRGFAISGTGSGIYQYRPR